MGVLDYVKSGKIEVWDDLYDEGLDDRAAPDLGDLVRGKEASVYADPEEFFSRTYLTDSMKDLIEDVARTLRDSRGGSTYLLTSLFGGGKTHTQIALYHAFNSPGALGKLDKDLAAIVAEAGRPIIVVMDGSRSDLMPHPKEPYRVEGFTIKTVWGMLAYRLGSYNKMRHLDGGDEPAPSTNLLEEVLSGAGGPVLILIDEIIPYIFNIMKSGLKDYGDKIRNFLDYLARAVENTPRVALVVSIQAEYKRTETGQMILFEEETYRGYAESVLKVLGRKSTKNVVPVSPDNVVKVLQKRVFKKIPDEVARNVSESLYKKYREHPELFGVDSDWGYVVSSMMVNKTFMVKDTYPFHPKYVEVLQEFVTRNGDLQKTRDAIRITRKVVRRFLSSTVDSSFIMPWHIDLGDPNIRSLVLTQNYREFEDVASKDIVERNGRLGSVGGCSKKGLAYKIALAVLLKTYTYETFNQPLNVFPGQKDVALLVYDPEAFEAEGFAPTDISDTLDEMVNTLSHFVYENGRYWFTPFPSVLEYVKKRAQEKLEASTLDLYDLIAEEVDELLLGKGPRGIVEGGDLFGKENTVIVKYGDPLEKIVLEDVPKPRLVVIVKPEVNEEEVRNLILMVGDHRRSYRNTVIALCPNQQTDFRNLLRFAARIKAAEEVMENLSEYYTDEDIRGFQQKMLKKHIDYNRQNLHNNILSTFTRVAYPMRVGGKEDVKWVNVPAGSAIIPQVEMGLEAPVADQKLRTSLSFKDLVDFCRSNLNWDLVEGSRTFSFKDLLDTFYTLVQAPLVTRRVVEDAVREGLDNFDIGISMGGRLYWKPVDQDYPEKPSVISDDAEIVPYRLAASMLKERLEKESGVKRVGKETYEVWFEVEFQGSVIRLSDLGVKKDWERILKLGKIVPKMRKLETGFMLSLKPASLTVRPGEHVRVEVSVVPVGSSNLPVRVRVDRGSVSRDSGVAPFDLTWDLGVLSEIGEHPFNIRGVGEDGSEYSAVLSVRVESPEEEVIAENLSGYVGAKLVGVLPRDLNAVKMAGDLLSKHGAVVSQLTVTFGEKIVLSVKEEDLRLVRYIVQKLEEAGVALQLAPSVEGNILLNEPPVLNESLVGVLGRLVGHASFRLMVEKK